MESEGQETIEKGFDLATRDLKRTIQYTINNSNLPPVVVKYVLNEILGDVKDIENEIIKKQQEEYIKIIRNKNEQKTKQEEIGNNENIDDKNTK